MKINDYLYEIVDVFVGEMDVNLIGVYLHGSLAMGCFNPESSDVDLLVICKEEISNDTKKRIVKRLLNITQGSPNQLEMSIILERYLNSFEYPTPFELHYFHPNYLLDENYICGGNGLKDPDLAAHLMVTYHRGIQLYGPEVKMIFQPIDKQLYIQSISYDIGDAPIKIVENPVYFTLNLCRVMYFLKDGIVSSKKEGGEWGVLHFMNDNQTIVKQCLNVYTGLTKEINVSNDELILFANWMIEECNQLI